jgi:cytochrome P450
VPEPLERQVSITPTPQYVGPLHSAIIHAIAYLTASWLMTYLGSHPDWRSKAAAEIEDLLASKCYSPVSSPASETPSAGYPPSSLSTRLASIPIEAWENETPVLDALIRETTRVAQPHTAMRRNLGPELYINNKIIPSGAYVIYPFSDVHLDPELYPDPWKFDPGRKEVTHVPFGSVGWGGGQSSSLFFFAIEMVS